MAGNRLDSLEKNFDVSATNEANLKNNIPLESRRYVLLNDIIEIFLALMVLEKKNRETYFLYTHCKCF